MCRKYKAIFFDWDGTAVISRKAKADAAAFAMKPLLLRGVKLVIVSGTTMENIADGKIGEFFTAKEARSLYLGLGRGAYNYCFSEEKKPVMFAGNIPDRKTLLKIHRICFEIHAALLEDYGLETDIVFSRPNYCKIDLMVSRQRGENLFMQENEPEALKQSLESHGIHGGLQKLLDITKKVGEAYGMSLSATCDAKYLEVGTSCKSDNVDAILKTLMEKDGIKPEECCYLGDEFVGIDEGLYGSDSFMITDLTKAGSFFDVSDVSGKRPKEVHILGGGVERFLQFLREQK